MPWNRACMGNRGVHERSWILQRRAQWNTVRSFAHLQGVRGRRALTEVGNLPLLHYPWTWASILCPCQPEERRFILADDGIPHSFGDSRGLDASSELCDIRAQCREGTRGRHSNKTCYLTSAIVPCVI